MTILFHPCYDTRCRLDPAQRGPALLDTLTLGPLGLLQELELRLGLTAATTSNLLRTVDYVKLLRDYLPAHPDSPFALRLRLMSSMWQPNCCDGATCCGWPAGRLRCAVSPRESICWPISKPVLHARRWATAGRRCWRSFRSTGWRTGRSNCSLRNSCCSRCTDA